MRDELAFEWDDEKARGNAETHSLTFDEAIALWTDAQAVELDATRPEDGEIRTKRVGMIEGRLSVEVFTLRGETVRLISARRANAKEQRQWVELS